MSETYTLSVRNKHASEPVLEYLARDFPAYDLDKIDSVFGFAEQSSLYGGRIFGAPQLSDTDISVLNHLGIGFRIPLTNHFFDDETYAQNRAFLKKYDNGLNSVICVNDDLTKRIKSDYGYEIEASVIKSLETLEAVNKALELYDTVVTPMHKNDDDVFLESLPKDRIRLFVNAFCAYTCPAKICYRSFSKINRGEDQEPLCSIKIKERDFYYKMTNFDAEKFKAMGFHKFKVLRDRDASS